MVTVIIVNWNSGKQIRACIDSVVQNGANLVVQIIVVDNGSTDGSDVGIEELENVTLIRTGINLGFGRACNLGARQAESDYFLFLNPDAALFPDTLRESIAFMQNPINQRVGICGVQLINETDCISRSCARFPSGINFVLHAVGLDRLIPHLGHVMTEWDHTKSRRVDHVIGAFYLVRRIVFASLQGFDERFFVYLEDLDFSYRAKQDGWDSFYIAEVQAFHSGGGTSNQVKARRLFYSLRSRILYAFKNFSIPSAVLVFICTIFIEPFSRLIYAIFKRSSLAAREIFSAYGMLINWLLVRALEHIKLKYDR